MANNINPRHDPQYPPESDDIEDIAIFNHGALPASAAQSTPAQQAVSGPVKGLLQQRK